MADVKCGRPSVNVASQEIEVSGTTGVAAENRPARFALASVSNPARGQAFFGLTLDRDGMVSIEAYSSDGRRVAELIKAWMPAGRHSLHWRGLDSSGNPAPPGVYFVRAKSAGRAVVARLVMLPR